MKKTDTREILRRKIKGTMFVRERVSVELEKLKLWLRARDTFLGDNYTARSLRGGLRMMAKLNHEEARWICGLFPNLGKVTLDSAFKAFSTSTDPRGKLYATLLSQDLSTAPTTITLEDESAYVETLKSLMEQGHGLACVELAAWYSSGNAKLKTAAINRACETGEPAGYFMAGCMYKLLIGKTTREVSIDNKLLDKSMSKTQCYYMTLTRVWLKMAVDLDYVKAFRLYGELSFDADDPRRYFWTGKAAVRAYDCHGFILSVLKVYDSKALSETVRNDILLEAGKTLKTLSPGLKDERLRSITGKFTDQQHDQIKKIIDMYDEHCRKVKSSIQYWTWISTMYAVPKDVRVVVAKWMWETRCDVDRTFPMP